MKTHFIVVDKLPKMLQKNLQSDLKIVSKWFSNNEIMVKSGKLQYMLLVTSLKKRKLRISAKTS